jgi:hypothetical protein
MLEKAIKTVQRTLRNYISTDERLNVNIHTKILSHLINSWAEVRVLKLVYESGAFDDQEKKDILTCEGVKERWQKALDLAFCKAFNVNQSNIDSSTVDYTARSRRLALLGIIHADLLESNQLRNRIAHGQWKYAFSEDLLSVNGSLTHRLRKENIVKLQMKLAMFKSLAQIIHDLAVSKLTFERDFDTNYRRIENQKMNFHNRKYEDYKQKMIVKRGKGLIRKRNFYKSDLRIRE